MGTTRNDSELQLRVPAVKAIRDRIDRDSACLPEDLLSVLLHDLRSPLGAISVLVDVMSTLSHDGTAIDARQFQLLQEASVKAQRMLDDAMELQSISRGSLPLTPAPVAIDSIVRTCLEKARHAPYYKNAAVHYASNGIGQAFVCIDVEKAEASVLCALEHVMTRMNGPGTLSISHSAIGSFVNLHLMTDHQNFEMPETSSNHDQVNPLRGRLGNRRLGESRYSLSVCNQVMVQMGGLIEYRADELSQEIIMRFPVALFNSVETDE